MPDPRTVTVMVEVEIPATLQHPPTDDVSIAEHLCSRIVSALNRDGHLVVRTIGTLNRQVTALPAGATTTRMAPAPSHPT